MPPRTSQTHPLLVDFVPVPRGRLGMTFAPGKVQPHPASGAPWARDLQVDVHRLHSVFGANVVVSVIELGELEELGIAGLGATLGSLGMRWIHVPVVDVGVPEDPSTWINAMQQVHADLEDGLTVVVHCKGGLGRTGTFAASILASFGAEPREAIAAVRAARKGTIENVLQENFVGRAATLWRDELR